MLRDVTPGLLFAVLSSASSFGQDALPTSYTVTNLGSAFADDSVSFAGGLSNQGHVVGQGDASAGVEAGSYAYLAHEDQLFALRPSVGDPTWLSSRARAVNDIGEVVGTYGTSPSFMFFGFYWKEGVATRLLDPVGFNAFPTAINKAGWIVGDTTTVTMPGVQSEGVLWDPNLQSVWLDGFVTAQAINDSGFILGAAPTAASGFSTVIWDRQLVPHVLESRVPDAGPGEKWQSLGSAQALNDLGQISGAGFHAPSGEVRPYLLTPADLWLSVTAAGLAGSTSTFDVTGMPAFESVVLVGDLDDPLDLGYRRMAGCGGVGVSMGAPRVVAIGTANSAGEASMTWLVPQALAGVPLRLQALVEATCDVSNVVELLY